MDWGTFPTWFYVIWIITFVGVIALAAYKDNLGSRRYHRKLQEYYAEKARQMHGEVRR